MGEQSRDQRRCPHCGQVMPQRRGGVPMPALKSRIFDAIRRAGQDGITAQQIIDDLGLPVTVITLKAHVWQINDKLSVENAPYRITGSGIVWAYRLTKVATQSEEPL